MRHAAKGPARTTAKDPVRGMGEGPVIAALAPRGRQGTLRTVAARTLLVLATLLLAGPAGAEDPFKVIVNASNGVSTLSRAQLSRYFLKKTTAWGNGQLVLPVQPSDERIRSAFSRDILGKSLGALTSYWNQVVFSGRDVPPLEKRSEDAVVDYVRSNAGAIGFVSPDTGTAGVKVVAVKD